MGSATSPNPINEVLKLQLARRGYQVHQGIFDASQFGGHTTRKRMYMVATTLNGAFSFPEAGASANPVWDEIILPHWDEIAQMDITDLKVTKDAITTKRARLIQQNKPFSPTLLKAQGQDTKDAVMIERNGRYYWVPVSVQKALNAIPEDFDLAWAPKDKAAQVIGQSICCKLHHAIMASVKKHIVQFSQQLTDPQYSLSF